MKVMITRPLLQAKKLAMQLAEQDIDSIIFPTITIVPMLDQVAVGKTFADLSAYDAVIFISVHAVNHAFDYVSANDLATVKVMAIGQATAQALENKSVAVELTAPPPFNSEALLSVMPLTTIANNKILIVRGCGGREFLAKRLRDHGAIVNYAEVYQRLCPDTDPTIAFSQSPDYIIVTSFTNLKHLFDMTPIRRQQQLLSTPLVVNSHRLAELATEMGFEHPALVSASSSDDAIVAALLH